MDSFDILEHGGPIKRKDFYTSLKGGISQEEYDGFCNEFEKRGCVTMKDWLRKCNLVDVKPFIEGLEKTKKQYYPDNNDILKEAINIVGVLMTYVLNKSLQLKEGEPDIRSRNALCPHIRRILCEKVCPSL